MAGHSIVLLLVIHSVIENFYSSATIHFTLEDISEINLSSNSNETFFMLKNILFKISSLSALEAKNNLYETEA